VANSDSSASFTYRDAGVDIERGQSAKKRIGELIRSTHTEQVLGEFGHFGGMFQVAPDAGGKILVSSADGVGTKLLVAIGSGKHESIGIDIVNHCVNDILCVGAKPLFFLDYFASADLDEDVLNQVIAGMARACRAAGCALVGGETAQLPGIYQPGTYDLAGFIVGMVDQDEIIDGSAIEAGDVVLGLPANGLHTNGYSLARAVFGLDRLNQQQYRDKLDENVSDLGETLGDALLRAHPSYLADIDAIQDRATIHGMAHITGGGIAGNLERIIPRHLRATIFPERWQVPPIFNLIQAQGKVDSAEMFDVFNMGIGYIIVASPQDAEKIRVVLEHAIDIGTIDPSTDSAPCVSIIGINDHVRKSKN
jgi:phosphoribosylformylglycinamidine cyclo-ligase